MVELVKLTVVAGSPTGKKTGTDVPPPGTGLVTVIANVPAFAISLAEIWTVNCEALIKVVGRSLPFHCAVEPETKPVPLMVSVNASPPGATDVGTRGLAIKGSGLAANAAEAKVETMNNKKTTTTFETLMEAPVFALSCHPMPSENIQLPRLAGTVVNMRG
jgi:hypothetical protein